MQNSAGASEQVSRANSARRTGAVVFVLIAIAFVAYAFLAPTTYRAIAGVQLRAGLEGEQTPWPEPLQAAARLRARLLEPALLEKLARNAPPRPPETPALVAKRIGTSIAVDTADARWFTISAEAPSPTEAQRVANELARQAAADPTSILTPLPGARTSSVGTTFVAAPLPKGPERPNRLLVVLVGSMIAVIWGGGAAVGRSLWDARRTRRARAKRTRASTELEPVPLSNPQSIAVRDLVAEVLRPTHGTVRHATVSTEPVVAGWRPHASLDVPSRRTLCNELLPFAVDGGFVVGVTAVPEVDSHKSRVASELAFAFAEQGHPRVLLLEADFHAPDIHRMMSLKAHPSNGFSEQLRSRVSADDDSGWHVIGCTGSLHVMPDGATGAPGMLLSNQFGEAIRSLRTYYNVIVLNGPPTSNELDCRVLDAVIDGVVVVSTAGDSPYLSQALAIFKRRHFAKVVGI